MKAQILGARARRSSAPDAAVPIQCSVTLDPSGRMLLGTDIRGALATLEAMGVGHHRPQLLDRPGPDARRDPLPVARTRARSIHCIPNAGLPINDGGRTLYPMPPEPMAETLREFVVGARRQHRRRLLRHHARPHPRRWSRRSAGARPRRRPGRGALVPVERHDRDRAPPGAGAAADRRAAQHPGLAQGQAASCSRTGIEELIPIAREQVEGGAHTLDVCMALTERTDEARADAAPGEEARALGRVAAVHRLDRGRR